MSGMQGAFIKFLERRKRVTEGYESANPQVQSDVIDQDRQGTTCNNTAGYTHEGKKRRRIRKCYLCGIMTPRMYMHMTRKHPNLTLQERHEYREIMLRETPVLKANGGKIIKKLWKCPLCPAITQRIDNHIVKIHGKKRGSKIMKALITKAKELEGERAAAGESTSSFKKYHKKNITQEPTSNELHVGEEGDSRPAEETSREDMEEDQTEEDGTDVDGTEANRTEEDGTQVDGTEANRTEEDGTEVDGTEANRTEKDGSEADGTEANRTEEDGTEVGGTEANRTEGGSEADGTEANRTEEDGTEVDGTEANRTEGGSEADGTEANRTEEDGTEVDGTEANRTEEVGMEADWTGANRTEEDGMEADRTIVGTEGREKTKQYSPRKDQTDITSKDQTGGDGLDKHLSQEDRIEEAKDEEDHPSQVPQLFVHDVPREEVQVKDKGKCKRIQRVCLLCGEKINNMSMHVIRRHKNLSRREKNEYRQKMLREYPIHHQKSQTRKQKPLLQCPLCPVLVQRIDGHLVYVHGKQRGSYDMKALIAKAKGIPNTSHGEELVSAFVKHLRMMRKRAGFSEDSSPRESGKKVKRMLKWAGGLDLVTKKEVLNQIVSKLWNMAPETGFGYLASLKRFIRFLITEEEASEVLTFEKLTRCLYRIEDFIESLSGRIVNRGSAARSKPTSE
ncbi:uncharacterized protein LOC121419879 [Lytechinus variegatus]|uniref:uncharacterized protein LOC121419879 n=1 Tax=Lytechinus variegatus TaxID=7654 RepID=UPI001BB1718F|nr:uncharacterized protein LOC121419879 [Lytechinus variegatus]